MAGARISSLQCVVFERALGIGGRTLMKAEAQPAGGSKTAMRPLDYLRILRRRWWVLLVGTMIGLALAFATQPSERKVIRETAPRVQYRATHLLLADPSSLDKGVAGTIGYDRLALLTLAGEVPKTAMKKLGATPFPAVLNEQSGEETSEGGEKGSPNAQRQRARSTDPSIPKFRLGQGAIAVYGSYGVLSVAAVPDPSTGALAITATGPKAEAARAANVFAETLVEYLDSLGAEQYDTRVRELTKKRNDLVAHGVSLDQQMFISGGDPARWQVLAARRAQNMGEIEDVNLELTAVTRAGAQKAELGTLEPASDKRVTLIVSPGGSAVSPSQRLLLGGAIGFMLALAILLLIEILGARVRDVPGTEGAARMPVIAEIPVVKITRADRFRVATASEPASLTAEAYRSLRTSILAMWQRHPKNMDSAHGNGHGTVAGGANGNGHANGNGDGHANGNGGSRALHSLLVTSPGPAEGKSISVVNLAAAFAETGVSVIVLDADFRRPTLCRYFDLPLAPNLGDLDLDCRPEDLEAVLQDTGIPGVRMAASAPGKSDPGHAIAVAKAAVRAAQHLADFVIVDSPPILLANDAADLALAVDASVLLARFGWTRRSGVVAAAELLRRLEATVIGVAIVGAEHGTRAGYYGYYGYYGYGYGYAHPGEVSITQRLLPWKTGRSPGRPDRRETVPTHVSQPTGDDPDQEPKSNSDPDEPWV